MNLKILRLSTVFLYLFGNTCFSQDILTNVKYQLESGVYLSTSNQTPFWLRSNQYGIVPLKSQFLTMRGSAHKEYDSTKKKAVLILRAGASPPLENVKHTVKISVLKPCQQGNTHYSTQKSGGKVRGRPHLLLRDPTKTLT